MFVWRNGFQKSLAQNEFNMFLDEWTSANESPVTDKMTNNCNRNDCGKLDSTIIMIAPMLPFQKLMGGLSVAAFFIFRKQDKESLTFITHN